MKGSEQVEAAGLVVNTTAAEVPGWEFSYFVDHEIWAEFYPQNEWIEIGQQAGRGHSCCTMYPFWAYNNVHGFTSHHTEYGPIAMDQWNSYTVKLGSADSWCAYFPGGWNVGCAPELPRNYATRLEVGAEMATEAFPPNAGEDETNYSAVGGEVRTWNKATKRISPEKAEHICEGDYRPGGRAATAGDITFGTC
jgi:hypothetical protein